MKPDYAAIINWARTELANINDDYLRRKSEIINSLATRLEGTIPIYKICSCISHELKGIVTAKYVRLVLPPEYKQQSRNRAKICGNIYAPPTEDLVSKNETNMCRCSLSNYLANYKHTEQDKEIIRKAKENRELKDKIISMDKRIKALGVKWHYREGYNP